MSGKVAKPKEEKDASKGKNKVPNAHILFLNSWCKATVRPFISSTAFAHALRFLETIVACPLHGASFSQNRVAGLVESQTAWWAKVMMCMLPIIVIFSVLTICLGQTVV